MSARLRLDLFTPLPPAMTDIANHSASLLPHLARRADLVLWTTQDEWTLPSGLDAPGPGVSMRRYDPAHPPVADLNASDAVFYSFGNNAVFHADIFRVAQVVPGIAVLHDFNLQHFFFNLYGAEADACTYLDSMHRHHGPDAAEEAREVRAGLRPIGPLVQRYPLTLGAVERALAIVVHNEAVATELRAQTRLPVYDVPLSLVPDGATEDGATEPNRSPAQAPYRLIVFGFIGDNRRLASVLHALAALPGRDLFRLDIYGQIERRAEVETLIDALGLRGIVACHGYVSADVLTQALVRAHLAINLRWPTMGEASGSQLRIWAHGLPSIVTRVGWYATLPGDAVFFVDPEREQDDLVRHLTAFHADQNAFLAAGQRGRALALAEHGPARYAHALLDIAARAGELRRDRAALDLAADAALRMAELMDPVTLRGAAPAVARAIASVCGMAPVGTGGV